MQTILQTLFNLNNTSYWHPMIWSFAAGLLLYYMPKRTEYLGGRLVERWHWFSALMLVFPYILWAGSRTSFIDTGTYIRGFMRAPAALSQIPSYLASYDKDQGYSVLVIVCKSLGMTEYHHFFMFVALFQMFCLVYSFRKYSENFWISIFLFVASTDYMSWMHNGIRQFIAVCMTFAAFDMLVRQQYIRFSLVVMLASTIHGSAVLMLPFAFVMIGPAMNRKTLLMIGGVALMIPFIDTLMPFVEDLLMDTQYDDMMTGEIWANDDGTNLIRVVVYSAPALVAVLGWRYIKNNQDPGINMCINASLITMAVYLVSSVTSGISDGCS